MKYAKYVGTKLVLLMASLGTVLQSAQGATLVVTSAADGGPGSLRAAVAVAANGDTIQFSLAILSTITLTNGELFITNDLTLSGSGASNLALSGGTNNRVLNIATNRTLSLSELTIRDGYAASGTDGGGILNSGTLVLSNCAVGFNRAGAYTGRGGGICNWGALTAVGCTFESNWAGYGYPGSGADPFTKTATPGGNGANGGGIFNGGSLNLHSCTFYANSGGRGGQGGGTSVGGYAAAGGTGGSGGAIFSIGSVAAVACTFSRNQAGPGGQGGLAISVFSGGYGGQGGTGGGGGGMYNAGLPGSVMVRNCILGLNYVGQAGPGGFGISAFGPDGYPGVCPDVIGDFTSQGRNLIGTTNGSTGFVHQSNGNIVGSSNNPLNPRLSTLQDNGGQTRTMSLLQGSPAIDAGDDSLTGTDQRGFARLSGAHVDIGACEGSVQLYSRGEALLVGDGETDSVIAIEVRSGASVGTFVEPSAGQNYQMKGPRGMLCVSNSLLVVNQNVDTPYNGEILKYDLNSGAFTGKLVPQSNVNAPYAPRGMIAGPSGTILVADVGGFDGVHPGRIARYNAQGAFLGNVNITGLATPFYPMGLVTGPDGLLYVGGVGNFAQGSINGFIFRFQFNAGTQNFHYLDTIVSSTAANNYSPGLHSPEGIVFGPDGNIYVTSFYASFNDSQGNSVFDRDAILVFNKQGQRVGLPIALYATNEARVFAQAMLFGPRGDLFVGLTSDGGVRRYTAASSFQQFTVLAGLSPQPWYLTFRATNPRTLAYEAPRLNGVANGDHFEVSWPASYTGWQLQVQTNTLGSGSNWVDLDGSTATNKFSVVRDPAIPSAFYRLAAP